MRKVKRVCPPSFQNPLPRPEGKFPFLPFHFEYAPNFNQSSPHQTWTKSTSQDSKRSATGKRNSSKRTGHSGNRTLDRSQICKDMQSDNYTPKPSALFIFIFFTTDLSLCYNPNNIVDPVPCSGRSSDKPSLYPPTGSETNDYCSMDNISILTRTRKTCYTSRSCC